MPRRPPKNTRTSETWPNGRHKPVQRHSLIPPGEAEVETNPAHSHPTVPGHRKFAPRKLGRWYSSDGLGKPFRGSSSTSTIPVCVKGMVQHFPFPC
jgi:hypothetical protein